MRFGLFQSGLAASGNEAYREGLRRIMLPRLLLRLEKVLQANRNEPANLYEPLKVYLMLGGQGPMDRSAVRNWVTSDWEGELYAGSDRAPVRAALARHLDALLDDKDLGASWANPPLNGTLVSDSANAPADAVSSRPRLCDPEAKGVAGRPGVDDDGILTPGDVKAFAQPDAVLNAKVPYFYTRAGLREILHGRARKGADRHRQGCLGARKQCGERPIRYRQHPVRCRRGCTRAISLMRGRR